MLSISTKQKLDVKWLYIKTTTLNSLLLYHWLLAEMMRLVFIVIKLIFEILDYKYCTVQLLLN